MSAMSTPEGSPTHQSPGPPLPDGHISPLSLTHEHRSLSSTFREELDVLIQDQVKKGTNSSSLWALRQIADFLSHSSATLALPTSPSHLVTVTPINDLGSVEPGSMGKAERLQRCKLASTYRLLDLYGWACVAHGQLTLRISKEQDHFLVLPHGLSYSEATALSLVKVNILGETVEQGSTALGIDVEGFGLHSALYSARPDVRCLLHLHTPASVAVSAMKCGLLPLSHEALLAGEVAYYSYSGTMEETGDKVELQKSLGPTCKVLVLRNHGIVALGESVEEAFYILYHVQAACQIQVSAMCSAGGQKNLILLDRVSQRPCPTGTVGWAGSTFGPLHKSRLGEHEFEALMRTLDNLGYRTGYAYRFPLLLERARARREVEVAAAVTAFTLEGGSARRYLRPPTHAHKQRLEKTRWLNMPNSSRSQESPGHQRSTVRTWGREGLSGRGSGSAVKVESASQFVPLFTDPQEVLEIRKKIREQQRQETNWAGPQSHLLAGVLCNRGLSQVGQSTAQPHRKSREPREERIRFTASAYRTNTHVTQVEILEGHSQLQYSTISV
uniref:Adducin 2 n=1 Tax=Scleropages formosus TaxID=113540 RepID=A0A8D0C556_SCLFO